MVLPVLLSVWMPIFPVCGRVGNPETLGEDEEATQVKVTPLLTFELKVTATVCPCEHMDWLGIEGITVGAGFTVMV
jgi:hypothetical protein